MTFYRDVIGLRVRIEGDGYVEFEMDNTKFSLFERSKLPGLIGREGGNPPCGEIGFLIEDVDVLPGTQNEHDGVTFGEHEQPVVGVRADAMVFTLTAGRRMSCSW